MATATTAKTGIDISGGPGFPCEWITNGHETWILCALHIISSCSLYRWFPEIIGGPHRFRSAQVETYPDHPFAPRAREALPLFDHYLNLPRKSETLAGIMSTVVPGSGYIYAEHYGDGITAFLISSLSIVGAVTAVSHENYAVAGIAGGIGLPFYFGNIYGSSNAARKWNMGVRKDMRNKISVSLDFDF